jgi:hypothetical protein
MTTREKPSATNAWAAIEEGGEADAEMDRILGLCDDALCTELTAAGFDVPALDEELSQFLDTLEALADIVEK